jgi:hypothetical protein
LFHNLWKKNESVIQIVGADAMPWHSGDALLIAGIRVGLVGLGKIAATGIAKPLTMLSLRYILRYIFD